VARWTSSTFREANQLSATALFRYEPVRPIERRNPVQPRPEVTAMTARAASRNSSRPRAAYTDTAPAYAAAVVCKEDNIPAADPLGDR
jgi:hypothetical protein